MKFSKGFTVIETIIILAVIIILVGIALPKYYQIRDRDRLITAENFANSLATASTLNFAECKHGNSINCKKITCCDDLKTLLPNNLPSEMTVTQKAGTPFPTIPGSIVECQVNFYSTTAAFKAIVNP